MLVAACGGNQSGGGGAATNVPTPASKAAPTVPAPKSAGGTTQGGAQSQQIEMDDDIFQPAQLTVPVGTKVTWVNKGKKAHTVVSNDKLFDSGLVNVGGDFSYAFTTPGTYSYHCSPHPKMVGRIVVQ
jgi:plastocyanin